MLVAEPVVELEFEFELVSIASNTDMPRGPIVINTGSPSFDFAWTTKELGHDLDVGKTSTL